MEVVAEGGGGGEGGGRGRERKRLNSKGGKAREDDLRVKRRRMEKRDSEEDNRDDRGSL